MVLSRAFPDLKSTSVFSGVLRCFRCIWANELGFSQATGSPFNLKLFKLLSTVTAGRQPIRPMSFGRSRSEVLDLPP